ncbi:MAG: ABC transporter ATP-binding protein [Bacilli bacterium]|nr:ABC transporter ATP-binding protein [Bacilli bacterium]
MEYKIEMLNITKTFGPLVANDNIVLQVKPGEVHALLGENGAGKSTLMSILFGLYKQDKGTIKIDGKEVIIKDPNDATDLKIGMVHQHFKLVPVFTVAESIILGKEPTKYGLLNLKECEQKIIDLSKKYELEVDPKAYIKDLSVGMQQRVEILKMLYRDSDILIFDEPTAVLTPQEIHQLMKIIRNFAKNGKTVIIITHKLNEIKEVADRCTILRRGKSIKTVNVKNTSIDELANLMVGREVHFTIDKGEPKVKEKILEIKNLSVFSKLHNKNIVNNISFSINRGEIVAIAGVEGNGQSELVRAIWGLLPIEKSRNKIDLLKDYVKDTFAFKNKIPLKERYVISKKKFEIEKDLHPQIIFKDENITNATIRHKINKGLGHIPEDRHKHGLVLDYTLEQNIVLNSFYKKEFSTHGWLNEKNIHNYANKLIEEYDVRSSEGGKSIARGMSGGNQQKAILAREVSLTPDLLIAVQPTRGLDVGAIEFVHKALIKHRDNDHSVLLVSYELDEIMNIADRILVMYNGEIVANILTKDTNVNELGQYMLGVKKGG